MSKNKDFPSKDDSGSNTLEIIQGISQAVANSQDGAHVDDGKGEKYQTLGLRREEFVDFRDRRLVDGFKIGFGGNVLILSYQSEISLKEVYGNKFEDGIIDMLEQCISFIKKEYKKNTKKSLGLKMIGEPEVNVEHMNKIRSWVHAKAFYTIEGIDLHLDPLEKTWQKRLSTQTRKWLGIEDK